jgi:spoIIIJ-associated protein
MQNAEKAKAILEEILTSMNIENSISFDEVSNSLDIDSPDHALLIGKKGDNLRALTHVVNAILKHQDYQNEWVNIDIAGYKKEKLAKLEAITDEIVSGVNENGRPKRLPAMNSYERRHIHTYLAEKSEIIKESEGIEPNRYIVVKKAI